MCVVKTSCLISVVKTSCLYECGEKQAMPLCCLSYTLTSVALWMALFQNEAEYGGDIVFVLCICQLIFFSCQKQQLIIFCFQVENVAISKKIYR